MVYMPCKSTRILCIFAIYSQLDPLEEDVHRVFRWIQHINWVFHRSTRSSRFTRYSIDPLVEDTTTGAVKFLENRLDGKVETSLFL